MDTAQMVKESLWHLDAQFDKDGWDQPPRLLMILPVTLGDIGGLVEMRSLPGWDEFAPMAHSAQGALSAMVRTYSAMPVDILRGGIPQNLFAVAFVSESWMLMVDKEEDKAAVMEAGRNHTISADPRRIEARFTYLQPVAGGGAVLVHERDGVAEMTDADSDSGEIPRLMGELVAALTR